MKSEQMFTVQWQQWTRHECEFWSWYWWGNWQIFDL